MLILNEPIDNWSVIVGPNRMFSYMKYYFPNIEEDFDIDHSGMYMVEITKICKKVGFRIPEIHDSIEAHMRELIAYMIEHKEHYAYWIL